ncbi:hypothetical protein AVEN_117354-1 [Araneus ventricosus]|uniref:Uncharacterized protein n=1 Tax=Araneus ventricosus TaxID=182803 RepID=A0A4Y2EVN1_ARAVE|nr:hypothetical protein AVEN_117354-1 [Araneus ventricosus]
MGIKSGIWLLEKVPSGEFLGARHPSKEQTLTSTWNREQLSIRRASTSFIETAKSLGHDVSKISVSPSTVYRARAISRSKMAKKIEETLFENPSHLVLHWDSKLLPSVANGSVKILEDIIAVLVTGKDFEHLP